VRRRNFSGAQSPDWAHSDYDMDAPSQPACPLAIEVWNAFWQAGRLGAS